MSAIIQKHGGKIKLVCILLILVGIMLIMSVFPMDLAVEKLKTWIAGKGILGPIVFGTIYIVAAVLFIPGSALTLASGGIFGLLYGFIVVSLASTTAAAISFLIARYFARAKVEALAENNPKFKAIDKAIGQKGWQIVLMLRLTPVFPFSIGNYLYGLTSAKFLPYVLASWIGMMPGTFLYVYLGKISFDTIAAASGDRAKTPEEWAYLIIGLIVTVIVTIYVTKLASRSLAEHTEDEPKKEQPKPVATPTNPAKVFALATIALIILATGAFARSNKDGIRKKIVGLFGPPPVESKEKYQEKADGKTFDHSTFDTLLKQYVDADGYVDYAALKTKTEQLDKYIATIGNATTDDFGRNELLALYINAYNAFTLKLILKNYPTESIRKLDDPWGTKQWTLAGKTYSLNELEHENIRPDFEEPRIHFALVCAAIGCPKLRNEAFDAKQLEQQLEDQTKYVHTHDRWYKYNSETNTLKLTQLYDWYGGDFKNKSGSVLKFVANYSPEVKAKIEANDPPKISYLEYSWKLNDKENK